jgi:hypothetical protein
MLDGRDYQFGSSDFRQIVARYNPNMNLLSKKPKSISERGIIPI